ncbi:hypothetical protein HAX54_033324 [Datura stramonium]|uniref:Uncharacterized protein n=1 Tax=Datura stramonium TaxID=4076 RepID=A0ABS8SD69_DATST|nr:hypothetical protein [Datura stramonium]
MVVATFHIYDQAFFTLNNGEESSESSSTMDDLQTISSVCFSCMENADKILKKTPNLWKLRCEVSKFDGSFPAFSKLKNLEMLKISTGSTLTWIDKLKFPSNLKKLTLSNFCINLNEVSALSNLEVLKLVGVTISSNTWKVNDEQFSKLKFLKLEILLFQNGMSQVMPFHGLNTVLKRCRYLKVIPSFFGYTPSLKSIEVKSCKESLSESSIVIKEMQAEKMAYSGFEVFIHRMINDTPTPCIQLVIWLDPTKVSDHQLDQQSSLRRCCLRIWSFTDGVIYEQVHSRFGGKHHLVEQVVGITLPASLKDLQELY